MQVSDNLDDYCDPSKVQALPFPYLGDAAVHFALDNGFFQFYGRRGFHESYEDVDNMSVPH
jgi:hypothetical protein